MAASASRILRTRASTWRGGRIVRRLPDSPAEIDCRIHHDA
jgi:hypothetical protein